MVLPSQVPIDPVHRGALPFRSAASDGSYLQGGVWRQTPSRARRAIGRAAAFPHTAERQDHTQGTHYSHMEFSRGKWLFLLCCHYCVCHVCAPLFPSCSTRSSPWREEEPIETSGRGKSRETWRSGTLWTMYGVKSTTWHYLGYC